MSAKKPWPVCIFMLRFDFIYCPESSYSGTGNNCCSRQYRSICGIYKLLSSMSQHMSLCPLISSLDTAKSIIYQIRLETN